MKNKIENKVEDYCDCSCVGNCTCGDECQCCNECVYSISCN